MLLSGAFAKLREVTISFVMSVRLPARTEHIGSQRIDFDEIRHTSSFRKSVKIIQVPLKPDKNNRYLHEDL